jgi:hypothetical protein
MPRNILTHVAQYAEPMLAEVSSASVRKSWLPYSAMHTEVVDTSRWQTRAARGLSWHRSGKVPERRTAH